MTKFLKLLAAGSSHLDDSSTAKATYILPYWWLNLDEENILQQFSNIYGYGWGKSALLALNSKPISELFSE